MSLRDKLNTAVGAETLPLLVFLGLVFLAFSFATPLFLTGANLRSMAFQMPVLGLLTLACLCRFFRVG